MTNQPWEQDALRTLEPIFRDLFLDDSIKISATTSPLDIEEWDSLAHVTLLASVEQGFDVHFTAEEMGAIVDVPTLLLALRGKVAKA